MQELFSSGSEVEKVFTGAIFSEGPASDRQGNVLFSDCSENIIYSFNEITLETSVWSNDSGHANGMNFDAQGRLVVCCDGKKYPCLLYTSPSPRDRQKSRMPSSA